jgi:hypothetical protein
MSDAPSTEPESQQPQPEYQEATLAQKIGGSFFLLFLLAWVLGGIGALIMSLVCFGFSGTMTEKIIGLALAFFLGPLYFIFYAFNKDYCRSLGANVIRSANRMMPAA